MKTISKITMMSAGLLLFTLMSCNSGTEQNSSTDSNAMANTETPAPNADATPQAPALTDPQIASVAVTANQIDVNYGKIAMEKSSNADVKKFAETMIKDHNDIIKQAVNLATKLNVTPESNSTTQSLLDGEKSMTDTLNSKSGAAFDKAYAENEAAYHNAVVNAVKTVLIPNTQNAELKSLLESVVPLLDHHLEMARELAAKFQ